MAEQYANPSAQSRGSPPATGHRGGGGLTMAEQYTREGASTQPPAPLQSRAGGLTMAQNYAEPSASGFESQSGYERSEVPSAPGPDYYNSSAGSNFGRAPAPNGQSSSSRSQSRSRSDRQQTHFVPSSSAPAVPTMNQTQLPGYPPRSVKSTAPTGILKNEGVGASYSSPSVPQVGQSRSRNHQPMDSDVSERTQAVGSFLDDYSKLCFSLLASNSVSDPNLAAAKSSSVGASSVVQAVGSPPPGQGHGQSPYGFSEFSEQSSSSGLGPTQPRSGRSGPGPRVAVPPSQAATTINGSLAPPPNRR